MPSLKFMIEELKRSILPFSISPLLVLIVIIGTKYLGWNADTEVPNYILLPLELRFNVESTYVLVILSAILSFVVIGLVNNYRDNLPKPERSRLLRFVPMASKWVTITFYFWAGAFFWFVVGWQICQLYRRSGGGVYAYWNDLFYMRIHAIFY
ncbi:hypothetical protein HJ106_24320 [Vibrio parahaemolyticus]|nr:hypothetical protein [Vibrio parahaemolyticus]MBE4134333.1 hypothetical protein [Vibrio parahaemolyticus]